MARNPLSLVATVVLFVAGSVVALACGKDETDEPLPPGSSGKAAPSTLGSFAPQYATAYCAVASPCCKDAGKNGDVKACETSITSSLAIIQETATYDRTSAKSCLDTLKALKTQDDACAALQAGVDPCVKAVTLPVEPVGGKKPAEACAAESECAPPTEGEVRCEAVGPDAKKICQHVLPGKDGQEPCVADGKQLLVVNDDAKLAVGTVYRCGSGLRCDAASRKCVAAAAVGAACSSFADCTANAFCDQGKCVAALADGAACTSDDRCKTTSFCGSKKTCVPYLAPGSPCSSDPDSRCGGGACANGVCTGDSDSPPGLLCPL